MSGPGEAAKNISDFARHRRAAERAGARLERCDPAAAALIALVASERGITITELLHPSRSQAPIALTRQLAMYLTHVMLGRTLTEVGVLFGRDRTTVSYACALIEDRRDGDDPAFDEELARLEVAIAGLVDQQAPEWKEMRNAAR